ncbi:MAG TPA: AtpZ/AtpI family protein [Bacteroidales bacterium]|nr:AtpZ/AtpI family protein [Bacteroidales bacterium]HOS15824.1 AtpZ/AtpI family protein [Bacteroidales bacterium]
MDKQKKIYRTSSNYLKYTAVVFQMLAVIVLFTLGGVKLDELTALSFPLFTLVLSFTGVCLGIYLGIKDFFKKNNKK